MASAFHLLDRAVQRALWDMQWTELRPIQEQAIQHLLGDVARADLVICAGTASGKTEAAFLPVISSIAASPSGSVRAMYVGPLKALINDQFRRVEDLCARMDIPVCKWHGDVGSGAKQRFAKSPAGVLLITPESLEAMLVLRPSQAAKMFGQLAYVVVDEMHAFLGNERGVQLVSLLHRLTGRAHCNPLRIGLSATLGDPQGALSWLRPGTSSTLIADSSAATLRIRVEGFWRPVPEAQEGAEEGDPMQRLLARRILAVCGGKTNLVFANAKAEIERLADTLTAEARAMDLRDEIVVHHGSLSREQRLSAEERLRDPRPCTAVCSNTLEMGIDIGEIDTVVQVSAPWSVAALTQRVGRSGRRGAPRVLRGLFPAPSPTSEGSVWDRLQLDFIQGVAAVELLLEKFVEPAVVAGAHLSTFVHQCLAFIAEAGGAQPKELFDGVVSSRAFGDVSKEEFKAMLSELRRHDLIEQMADGRLILGLRGEQEVKQHTFYATFSTQPELRVMLRGEEIGMVSNAPASGEQFILSGRPWKVDSVDTARREIIVSPGEGGDAKIFNGTGAPVHAAIHERMRSLLLGSERLTYLDGVALEILDSARAEAAVSGLDRGADVVDQRVDLFPFAGSRVQRTLGLILAKAGLKARDKQVGFELASTAAAVASALRDFETKPDTTALAEYADTTLHQREQGAGKFERFVAPAVWRRAFAAEELDQEGTVVAARRLADALR